MMDPMQNEQDVDQAEMPVIGVELDDSEVPLTPLQKAHLARQKKIEDGTFQVIRMSPVERAKANPNSKALAIRAMCYSCVGGERAVDSIRNCTTDFCALYPHRPYQVGSKDTEDLQDIEETELETNQE